MVSASNDRLADHRGPEALVHLLEFGAGDGLFDRFVEIAAAALGVTAASITIPIGDRMRSYGAVGTMPYQWPRSQSASNLVATSARLIVVEDLAAYPDREAVSRTLAAGNRFFAGAPLLLESGRAIGSLNVLGGIPRAFDATEREALRAFAALAMLLVRERLERLECDREREEYRGIITDAPSAIVSVDRDGKILSANPAAHRLFGWTRQAAATLPFLGIAPERRAAVAEALGRVIDDGVVLQAIPTIGIASDGRRLDLVVSAAPKRDGFGVISGASVIVEDSSADRRRAEIAKRRSDVLELAATDARLDGILECLAGYVNHAIPTSISCVLVRCEDGSLAPFSESSIPAAIRTQIEEIGRRRLPFPAEYSVAGNLRLDSHAATVPQMELYSRLLTAGYRSAWRHPIYDSRNTLRGAIVSHVPLERAPTDDESRTLQEACALAAIALESDGARATLEHLALHDALTSLPNRASFERRLEVERRRVTDGGPGFALAMLDVDRFKVINDSLGHAVGDQLIVEIGNRLRATVRESDFVARLAGDEFLIILRDVVEREIAMLVMEKILAALEQQFAPGGHELFVRASVGIAFFPIDASEYVELMRCADLAMYSVKERGTRIGFVDATSAAPDVALALETELNRAVMHDEFELFYQPSIDARSGRITGAEALLRWRHPRLGILAPGHFIAIAEQTGLVVPIGEWVLREACRFAKRWSEAGGPGVVSVNVSARQFENRGFVDTVLAAIDHAAIEPSQLWLEITETLIMRSPETTTATLAALRRRGVRSTIDDFGTGYSSLSYLKRFPIAGLKIDRAFVKDLGSENESGAGDRAIIATIVALGAALRLSVIAEGAETRDQIEILRVLGCDHVQGYYFARPMPERDMLAWHLRDDADDTFARAG